MLEFSNTVSIADIINFTFLILAIIGVCLTFRQLKDGLKTQRAIFFKDLYSTMYQDENIREIYYQIEYSKFSYDQNFHGSETEILVDRLLSFANMVCYLYSEKNISEKEMEAFKYEFLRIYKNNNIKNYLSFLKSWYAGNKTGVEPYIRFVKYCESNKI